MARQPYQVLVYLYRQIDGGAHVYAIFQRADDGNWQAVAGGGEEGETPLQAAQRETLEETGLSPEAPFIELQTVEPIPVTEFKDSPLWGEDLYIIPQYCFGVPAPAGEVRLSHEHTQVRWLTFAEAWPLLKYEGNRTALWELECRLRGEGPRRGPKPGHKPTPGPGLLFLKLGGSLITDKPSRTPPAPRRCGGWRMKSPRPWRRSPTCGWCWGTARVRLGMWPGRATARARVCTRPNSGAALPRYGTRRAPSTRS